MKEDLKEIENKIMEFCKKYNCSLDELCLIEKNIKNLKIIKKQENSKHSNTKEYKHQYYINNKKKIIEMTHKWQKNNYEKCYELEKKYYHKTMNAENRYKKWSKKEEKLVIEHNISDRELSKMLGRSMKAINVKRAKLKRENKNAL